MTKHFQSFLLIPLISLFSGDKSHLRVTSQKGQPSAATVSQIQKTVIWKLENEFYEFAAEQFRFAMKRINVGLPLPDTASEREKEQIFFYEKIRPK